MSEELGEAFASNQKPSQKPLDQKPSNREASNREAWNRKELKQRRATLTPKVKEEYDVKIADAILHLPEYQKASQIICYRSLPEEIDTDLILRKALQDGKKVFSPRVLSTKEGFMECYQVMDCDEGEVSSYGILEPLMDRPKYLADHTRYLADHPKNLADHPICSEDSQDKSFTICLVPGLAFDENGNRIGYGGGFYDRYLARHNEIYTIGLFYELQKLQTTQPGPFDVPLQMIVTETTIRRNAPWKQR